MAVYKYTTARGVTFTVEASTSARAAQIAKSMEPSSIAGTKAPRRTAPVAPASETTTTAAAPAPVTTGVNWAAYYRGVLANPTATAAAKAEATRQLGTAPAATAVTSGAAPVGVAPTTLQRWSDPITQTSYEGAQRKPTDIPLGAAPRFKTQTPTPTSTYTGASVVDYLKSVGQASDYASRAKLAAQKGITNYTGTAAQNTQLLAKLRAVAVAPAAPAIVSPEKQAEIDRVKAEIARIQKEIASKQAVLTKSLAAGIKPGEAIPSEFLAEDPLLKDLAPVPKDIGDTFKDILSGTAGAEDYYKLLTQQLQADIAKRTETEKEQAGWLEKTKEFFTGRPTAAELEKQARQQFLERFGLPKDWEEAQMQQFLGMQSEIATLRTNLVNVETREQQALLSSEQRLAPMAFIRGEQSLIQRQYAIEKAGIASMLSAKAAIAEMYRGNVDMADRYIKDYISASTYDLQQQKEEINWFMDYYKDQYNALDTNIRDTIKTTLSFVEKQEELKKAEMEAKWAYITDAAKGGVDLGLSGAEIDKMEIQEVAGIYSKKVAAVPDVSTQIIGSAETGYTQITTEKKTGKIIKTEPIGVGGVGVGVDLTVDSWVKMISAGQATIANVPIKLKNQVIQAMADLIPDPTNPEWVRQMYEKGKANYESDEQQESGMGKIGVPEEIIRSIIPEAPKAIPWWQKKIKIPLFPGVKGFLEKIGKKVLK